ncbi:MAG TPA: DnaJ domain-containing protein, partial [Geminicoccaceae bacterium]
MLAMRLDRGTGRVDGEVRRGPLKGARLSRLGLEAVLRLLDEARLEDPPSVDLLEAYLDRRDPGWRGREAGPSPGGGATMDEATALGILGLTGGATEDEVKAAHRRLMAKLHPDHGGSTYLASQINQAKDVLLGRGGPRRSGASR